MCPIDRVILQAPMQRINELAPDDNANNIDIRIADYP